MRKTLILGAAAALSLAACQKQEGAPAPPADAAAAPAAEVADAGDARRAPSKAAVSIPQLAYSFHYALAAPPRAVRGLMEKHEAMCWAAGPAVCQVTGADVSEDGPDKISASLTLRAQPEWLRSFRTRLEGDTEAVGGRMVRSGTETEDLSRSLVDTEAALRAKTVLRDRLEATLKTRPGKAKDFFEMEQQLAQVQGEIDASRSELAMMRTRVAASELKIDYRSEGVLAPRGSMAPLGQALGDVAAIFVGVLAFLIRSAAVVAPLAGLGALAWWATRGLRSRKTP